ncbi:MAG TPA: ribonuclease H-like domain-containing protein [Candidatus Brocadiia bacterium]|nr:ribonuclease H-like domain-containing protein [Candidatus Brocadiales bacterium]
MLKSSFIHVPGVGYKTERYIWGKGVFSWEDFLVSYNKVGLPDGKIERIKSHVTLSIAHLQNRNVHFFAEALPKSEIWRVYSEFKDKVAFLDIETTGLSAYYSDITLIGIFDGKDAKTYIAGKNLDSFVEDIKQYDLMVTFNGTLFDAPFIATKFSDFVPPPHIDLRFLLKRLGYSGGLKKVERQLGVMRPEGIKDLNGFDAVILWNRYMRGDIDALDLLIEYNLADVTVLKVLMEEGYRRMQNRLLPEYNLWKEGNKHEKEEIR